MVRHRNGFNWWWGWEEKGDHVFSWPKFLEDPQCDSNYDFVVQQETSKTSLDGMYSWNRELFPGPINRCLIDHSDLHQIACSKWKHGVRELDMETYFFFFLSIYLKIKLPTV